jgi:DNA-binding transcriptional LysR family regulator
VDSLSGLGLFLAVAEERSFAAASRRLGLSASATGKAVSRLEARLGVALFNRTTRQVSLTAEGELLLDRARQIREAWRETEASLSQAKVIPQGRLRVAAPAVGYRLLAPHLAEFAERYPHVVLDLDFDDRIADLTIGRIDVAIRSGVLADSSHRSRRLRDFRFLLCAAPDYLAAAGMPKTLEDLRTHRLIRYRYPGSEALQPWRFVLAVDVEGAESAVICTNMEAVLSATLCGLGISQMPDFLVADALATGRLATIFDQDAPGSTFSLLWHETSHGSPKLRAFIDFCVERLS